MPVKLNHYYTIIPERREAYERFVINDFIPGINQLGVYAAAGWSVLVGAYSEIVFESVSKGLDHLEKALRDPIYKELNANLLNYVKNYKTKVLMNTGKIDSYTTDFKANSIKFNQMWDVISHKKAEYDQFTAEEFYPCLEELGIKVAREWEVLIGDGPHIICEGRADDLKSIITNLQGKKFQQFKRRLREFVEDYQSRILSFHIQKDKTDTYHLSAV